jgi:hypothetical protein
MTISQTKLDEVLALVRKKYPDWTGFADPRFVQDEVAYKQATIAKAKTLLSQAELERLIAETQFDEFIKRLEQIGRNNNLLYQSVPLSGHLSVLYQPNLDKPAFCRAMLDLLYGEGPAHVRLTRYADFVKANNLPNKWTLPTYFLFICHPDTEMFVKPRTTKWFLEFVGGPPAFTSVPTPPTYVTVKQCAQLLKDGLQQFGPRDMVDIQSLIWVCAHVARGSAEGPLTDDRRKEFQDLFREFLREYPATSDGQHHLTLYLSGREEARRNFEAVVAGADRGDDVTELVLAKFLPHADTAANRQRGAWTFVAPAMAKDIKAMFEASGFTRPEDWPIVAKAILKLVRRCTADSSQLSDACREFAQLGYTKGFQTGMITPILNALRPDDFLLINNKSREVINHFAGASYGQSLMDYPAVNETGRDLIEGLAEVLKLPDAPSLLPADLFDMFCHWLVGVKNYSFGSVRYWKIAPGENAWQWEECRKNGFIGIGWGDLADLTGISHDEFRRRRDALIKKHDWTKSALNQVWKFAQIKPGDRIVANDGTTKVLGIGRVTGAYYFVAGAKLGHRLPVQWDDLTPRTVNEEGWRRTLIELDAEKFARIAGSVPPQPPINLPVPPADYSLTQCAEDTGLKEAELTRWVRAIERKGQAILYGPPGTGKTFVAEKLARHLIGGGDGFADLVQFHPSYAYEDFMQGIRPQRVSGGLDYPTVSGRFLEFCDRAARCTGSCVLIIDEINRANLARVFGELMYLLEYRQQEIPLAGGGRFKIPGNVRLLGTMNTADRSIALVDYALRRRFAFLPLYPNFDVLRRYHQNTGVAVDGLIRVLQRVNQAIDDPHYHVGISFFLRENLPAELADIWQMEIEPYLEEFFFDQRAKYEQFRWPNIQGEIGW